MRIRLTHKTEKLAPIWVTRVTSERKFSLGLILEFVFLQGIL